MDHISAMLGPHIQIIDQQFAKLCIPNTQLQHLWGDGRWTEGPVYFADSGQLLFSDIPNNRMMRFDERTELCSIWDHSSDNSNGNTRDRQGRLVSCRHLSRSVIRIEYDGSTTVLASHYQGKRLNSPNDVVVSGDGAIWFSDPSYGIDSNYEGIQADSEIGACYLYRICPDTGDLTAVATDLVQPNGLAFSADERFLYVSDTGASHIDNGPRHIRKFSVNQSELVSSEVFSVCEQGLYDGFRLDSAGNLWCSAADGVHCLNPAGKLIGKIRIPETVSNLCFGGIHRNRLYITATTSLYALYLSTTGLSYF